MNVDVQTRFNPDLIVQEIRLGQRNDMDIITRQVINLSEQGIRDALIKLGWTPPP